MIKFAQKLPSTICRGVTMLAAKHCRIQFSSSLQQIVDLLLCDVKYLLTTKSYQAGQDFDFIFCV